MFFSKSIFLFFSLLYFSQNSYAWWQRGHDIICQASGHLVKNPELKHFLKMRGPTLSYMCNIPDTHWKQLPREITVIGNPTHFATLLKHSEANSNLILQELSNKKSALEFKNFLQEFGSAWWRADQFYNLSFSFVKLNPEIKLIPPKDKSQLQDANLPYNKAIFQYMQYIGIMGHFVGDIANPFHSSTNYDGYDNGHGGIHGYYEGEMVAAMGMDEVLEVHQRAELELKMAIQSQDKKYKYLQGSDPVLMMQELSKISEPEVNEILKLDKLIKPSQIVTTPEGLKIKTPAERASPQQGLKWGKTLLVKHLARGAALYAKLAEMAYNEIDSPTLKEYELYQFPIQPDFIPPDYINLPKTNESQK